MEGQAWTLCPETRPTCRNCLQSAFPEGCEAEKLAGSCGSVAGSHSTLSMPLSTPQNLARTCHSRAQGSNGRLRASGRSVVRAIVRAKVLHRPLARNSGEPQMVTWNQ